MVPLRRFCLSRGAALAVALLLAAHGCVLQAQASHDACSALPKVEVPEVDRPTIADVRAAGVKLDAAIPKWVPGVRPTFVRTGCYALDLYYGKDPAHAKLARSCVLARLGIFRAGTDPAEMQNAFERANSSQYPLPAKIPPLDQIGLEQGDAMVMAMVYANGEGVKRDLPLARQFVCQAYQLPATPTPSAQLQQFNAIFAAEGRFDFCKHTENEHLGRGADYQCAAISLDKATEARTRLESAIGSAASTGTGAAFASLLTAWRALDEANQRRDEADCAGGTSCGVIATHAELDFVRRWVAELEMVENGIAPAAGTPASSLPAADASLNRRYRDVLANAAMDYENNVPTTRETERAWIRYRDAWVAYGTQRWPETSADQWRAWQTLEWMKVLGG